MYTFIARYENMLGIVDEKAHEVDLTPLGAADMGGLPEEQFAWRVAATRAWGSTPSGYELVSLRLLSK